MASEATAIPFQGQRPYGVTIDRSDELTSLVEQAEKLRDLPFAEKMEAVTQLAVGAMENAWEGSSKAETSAERERFQKIVFQPHTLSEALKQKAGCCRYQATLFLILGAAAQLGDRHYLQSTPVGTGVNTCFNDVVHDGKLHHVSVFCASLKDKSLDYSQDHSIFDKPHFAKRGTFLSYVKDAGGEVALRAQAGHHAGMSQSKADMYQNWAHDYRGITGTALFFRYLKPWTA